MKKNILIVQALLLLPLIVSSLILGSEKSANTRRNRKKKNSNNLMMYIAEQTKTQEKTPQETLKEEPALQALSNQQLVTTYHTISTETESDEASSFPFADSQELVPHTVQQQIIDKSTEQETASIPDALFQSVILPTEKKGLDFFDTILYYTSKKPISRIIFLLQNKTFKTDNQSYFEWLNEAIEAAIKNEDFDSLATIATLCQADEYKKTIRIPDEIAQPAVALCSSKYNNELSLANKAIQNKCQDNITLYNIKTVAFTKVIGDIICAYTQDIQNIGNDYDKSVKQELTRIANIQDQINNFSKLNKSIRDETTNFLATYAIELPENQFNKKIEESNKQLTILSTINQNMPPINNPQLSNSLAIDNK